MKTKHHIFALCLSVSCLLSAQTRSSLVIGEEFIFPVQSEHCHGSSIVELPNGDLLACWFQGSGERTADDVRIMGARKKKESAQWSSPFVMADTEGIPDCNPVLFLNNSGKLFLVWIAVQGNVWQGSVLVCKTSTNYLSSDCPLWEWQTPILLKPDNRFVEEIEKGFAAVIGNNNGWSEYALPYEKHILEAAKDPMKRAFGWMTRIKPLLFPDGRIVLPLYSDGFNLGLMALSDNNGETWHPSLPLVGRGPIQPALALCKNGEIIAYCRDSGDAPSRIWESRSTDRGETWSPATKTEIPSQASVELLALRDGRFVLIVNNNPQGGRGKLSLLLSNDEAKSWHSTMEIESDPEGSFSYPALIQTADGTLHLTYSYSKGGKKSIKHLTIDLSNTNK